MLGGAVFAAVIAAIALGAYYEVSRITPQIGLGYQLAWPGYAVIFAGASLALIWDESWTLPLFVALAMLLPILMIFRMPTNAESFSSWVASTATGVYLGIPTFAAISLRQTIGDLEVGWASDLGAFFSISDESRALGMGWAMTAVAATWLSDTFALFVGRALGRTPLIPHISPRKTLEGAAGGVLGAVVATVGLTLLLGLPDVSVPLAIVFGVLLAVVGIGGDLTESFIKRSGGVKDSGTLIPGHGGVFDRVDALWPTLLVTWVIVQYLY